MSNIMMGTSTAQHHPHTHSNKGQREEIVV